MVEPDMITHAGFVAIIGAPNAGKSTLVNQLVGGKVSIVTQKVQTTRFPIRGILQEGQAQIVLVDTPGIFSAKKRLDRAMVKSAWSGVEDSDAIVHVIDAAPYVAKAQDQSIRPGAQKSMEDDTRVIEGLKHAGRRAILALNKVDLFPHDHVLPLIATFHETGAYEDIIPISAEAGEGVGTLAKTLSSRMPEGGALFPSDQIADAPLALMAAEITREKLMLRLHDEIPYQLTVETEAWQNRKDGSVRIQQVVIVGRETHKGMVLGKGGQVIKAIGEAARQDIAELLGRKAHLLLFVKVDPRWMEKRETYAEIGLDYEA